MSEPLHLKNREKSNEEVKATAGMASLLGLLLGIAQIRNGEFPTTFFVIAGLAASTVYLIKKLREYFRAEYFAILHEDSFKVSNFGENDRLVHWDQVKKLRWISGSDNGELIVYTEEIKTPLGSFPMDLDDLTPEDRLTFIKYVRLAAADVEQERWPSFCRREAVPLVEKLNKNPEATEQIQEPDTWQGVLYANILKATTSSSLIAYLLSPITAFVLVHMVVRRKTWWTFAGLLGLSALINIRLVWGEWTQPFANYMLGIAAYCFVSGLITPLHSQKSDPVLSADSIKVILYLAVMLIFSPMPLNVLLKGWFPANWNNFALYVTFAILFLGSLLIARKQSQKEGRDREQLEQEALNRWEEEMSEATALPTG